MAPQTKVKLIYERKEFEEFINGPVHVVEWRFATGDREPVWCVLYRD